MNNTRLLELTNKYIDNELTVDEQSELNKLLKDENNKEYFNSMVQTIFTLETHKPAEQLIDVKYSVVNKIEKLKEEKMMNNLKSWWSQLFNGTKISYAFSFALGAVLVAFVFSLQSQDNDLNDAFMKGTISNRNFDETYFLNETSFEGAVKVKHSQDIVILDVNLSTSELVDCELKYDKNLFALYGVKSVEANSSGKFSSGGSFIRLSNLESNHYMVFLRNIKTGSSKVQASFYNGNTLISNLTIDINY